MLPSFSPSPERAAKIPALTGEESSFVSSPGWERPLCGLFHVSRSRARIAVRGGGDTGLIASGAAAGGRPLGSTATDAGGGGILELVAHAIELRAVIRAEPTTRLGRLLTMTTTTTTHNHLS
jgi:hypothetical protein